MGKKKRLMAEKAASKEEVQRLLKNADIRKVLDEEIRIYMEAQFKAIVEDNLSVVLWVLHRVFGFGKKRLRRFCEMYDDNVDELLKFYQMFESASDADFCARRELKKIGIDVSEFIKKKDVI